MTKPLTITLIIPARDAAVHLPQVLAAAQANAPAELIVVDDGSRDETAHIAECFCVRVIRLDAPQGPAAARNRAARVATADVLFFVDADVVLPPNAISLVRNYFETHPNLSALFGSYDDAPAASNFISQYKNLLHHYTHQMSDTRATTFWAGCGAIRRDVFLAIGGFDETYRTPSIEDIELGARLVGVGYTIHLVKALQAKHLKRWTFFSLVRSDFFARALPWSRLIMQRRAMPRTLNLDWTSRVSVVLVWAMMVCVLTEMWAGVLGGVGVWMWLNRGVYRFFARKRGWRFALRVAPLHWLYYFYSGGVFGWAVMEKMSRVGRWGWRKFCQWDAAQSEQAGRNG
jgi:glycosyltransferase involved in cell wall biosynthesis